MNKSTNTCPDCGHPSHTSSMVKQSCATQIYDGIVWVSCDCKYCDYEDIGRCIKMTKNPDAWGCHKPNGHDGYCSTHWDCGYIFSNYIVCGKPHEHWKQHE
jgi:hypothetical protein